MGEWAWKQEARATQATRFCHLALEAPRGLRLPGLAASACHQAWQPLGSRSGPQTNFNAAWGALQPALRMEEQLQGSSDLLRRAQRCIADLSVRRRRSRRRRTPPLRRTP